MIDKNPVFMRFAAASASKEDFKNGEFLTSGSRLEIKVNACLLTDIFLNPCVNIKKQKKIQMTLANKYKFHAKNKTIKKILQ